MKLDAKFQIAIKDLEPLSMVTGNKIFNGSGTVNGSIRGTYQDLSLQGDVDITDFFYGNADAGTLIHDAHLALDVQKLKSVRPLKDIRVHLNARAAKLNINRTVFDSSSVELSYLFGHPTYSAADDP